MAEALERYERWGRYRVARAPRRFLDRTNPLEVMSREMVRERYRFFPETILLLVDMIDGPATLRSVPLPPLLIVLCALQFFATGVHHIVIAQCHGVSRSSVVRAVQSVASTLARQIHRWVHFPRGEEAASVKRQFYGIAAFPNVLGVVDGTHIKIQRPINNEADFVNRKGFHSLNIQMVCDARFRITDLIAKWPGSVHDSRMFTEGTLCADFMEGQHDGLLLGDSGYGCRTFLMTPYANPQTVIQERFNTSLCRTRVLIEQTFGMLKRRFPLLKYGIRTQPEEACKYVAACVVLHNFGFEYGDVFGRDTLEDDSMPVGQHVDQDLNGRLFRDYLCERHFSN